MSNMSLLAAFGILCGPMQLFLLTTRTNRQGLSAEMRRCADFKRLCIER